MQRKFAFLFHLFVLLSLIAALTGQGTVYAQDEQPPVPPSPQSPQPPQLRWPAYDREFMTGEGENGDADQDSLADAEKAFTLGQPGLSYRYVQTFGVTEEAYPADTTHLNRPVGLFMDNSNNLYVAEESGERVLKYNPSGTNLLTLGTAGLCFTDDYVFCSPKDMGLDSNGNLWVADGNRVVAYNASGTFLRQLPSVNPWEPGTDTTHFDFVNGIAFDGLGRMYVSDTYNHRVQVYTFSAGAPVYHSTIGVTAQEGSDNAHFSYPFRLAIDSSNRVYVVDQGNNRIQRCTRGATWVCATFASGFNMPHGITIDNGNNVYIADTGRIRKCLPNGTCSDFVTNTYDFYDLEADSGGNVYGAGTYDGIVVKYNSGGAWQGIFLGEELVPYQTDDSHYYSPRVAIDGQDNIIIVEETGQRLLKLNSAGNLLWSVGVPGVDAPDNDHLNYPHGVAVDTSGKIYVADNNRVQIFSAAGAYLNTIGGSWGSGNYQFEWASGIAVDTSGVIYVADCPNNRVQVYNSALTYIATIGQTGVAGSDNAHLTCPIGVGVDAARNVYVADAGNNRVQKFNSSRVWQMTLGTPGPWGSGSNAHSHFGSGPEDIAVDAQGRIFVADIWNNRVQVFNSTGGYLTTIAGAWGTKTGELRNASGVDVDSQGNVYVSDLSNHRIQKFSPGVPGWQQVNINGFGDPSFPSALSMAVFNNQLYAGASNWDGNGASIWRTSNGTNWSRVVTSGFGQGGTNPAVIGMIAFKGNLYAGTGWGGAPGQLWRSSNGTTWTQITGNGLGTSSGPISTFAVYGNTLYAGTCGDGGAAGAQIWRSATGNSGTWVSVVTGGLTTTDNACVTSLKEFNGNLYAGVENPATGAQIWRSATGNSGTWTQVNTSGFGTSSDLVGGFAMYAGYLYIGTRGGTDNAQLWRSNNGTTWNAVTTDGFGDPHNWKVESLYAFNGALYAGLNNDLTGLEVWRFDGTAWNQVNADGFGDSNNQTTLWSNETLIFNNNLYIGVFNGANGAEIWRTVPVTISGNVNVAGVSLSYNEGVVKTTTSLASGSYSLPVSYSWSGTVTPSHPCFTFNPASRNYSTITSNQTSQNYTPTLIGGYQCRDRRCEPRSLWAATGRQHAGELRGVG
jgi:hypothetical protein